MRSIGVFDSGIGGLTVLRSLAEKFPHENFIYLGDTARLPYGSKSPATIANYTKQNLSWLAKQNCKALVIACNSASSHFHEKEFQGLPVLTVIEPGCQKALQVSSSKVIGVLGTRATILSQSYKTMLNHLDPSAVVFSQACPLFVPLAEEGWDQDPITNLIVYRYVQALKNNPGTENMDTVILGCTHYPLLKGSIQKALGPSIHLIESGEIISETLLKTIKNDIVSQGSREISIVTTDESDHFQKLALQFLNPHVPSSFSTVDL